jgi:hypothetical protein
MTYYDKELAKLAAAHADLKLTNGNGSTRWLTVSPEQIKAILEILNKGATK